MELLAAIAIIAILDGMLPPALEQSTGKRKKHQCLGGMKQKGSGEEKSVPHHRDRYEYPADIQLEPIK